LTGIDRPTDRWNGRLIFWCLGPPLAVILAGLIASGTPPELSRWLLLAVPAVGGLIQWACLHVRLGRWGWLWIPACYLGVFLSFLGMWWFLLCVGLGVGLAQAPLLSLARMPRVWLWPLAGGVGWCLGMGIGMWTESLLPRVGGGPGNDTLGLTLLYVVTLLVHSLSTAAALACMEGWGRLTRAKGELPGARSTPAASDSRPSAARDANVAP